MRGRARNADHRLLSTDVDHKTPTVHVDYGFLGSEDKKAMPVLFCKASPWKMTFAVICIVKGPEDEFSIKSIVQFVKTLGIRHFVFKSDQEPALLSWKEAVVAEFGTGHQIVPELSPVGESESNGAIEVGVGQISGELRTWRDAVEVLNAITLDGNHDLPAGVDSLPATAATSG